jgi:hypothetical protein
METIADIERIILAVVEADVEVGCVVLCAAGVRSPQDDGRHAGNSTSLA